MIVKLLRGPGRGHGIRLFCFALCACASLCVVTSCTTKGDPPRSPYFNQGLRWIGTADTCMAPADWTAERLFASSKLPAELTELCTYTWTPARRAAAPTSAEVSALFTVSGAQEMTEDVPVVFQSGFTTEEVALYTGLSIALRAQVGDVSLLPNFSTMMPPVTPAVRVVVIDSAPDAPDGPIPLGASRHGDTLAHLIKDLVCQPDATGVGSTCAAEVTTALALSNGTGTLSDLASAIERAVLTWQTDLVRAPTSTPGRLVLNLSLGWEDTPGIADCSSAPPPPKGGGTPIGLPARTVQGILQYAASQGALIVAAAGNDSGGPAPRKGLVCPGRYQAVQQDADPTQSLVVAVSGVDYSDHPLETVRPLGITGIVGLGLGGVAWDSLDPVPPQLTGSSVSTAVVSAVSALVWAYQPTWTPGNVTAAVYKGGVDLMTAANECPLSFPGCRSHRASVCGALQAAADIAVPGTLLGCSPAPPKPWSCPDLPAEIAALVAASPSVPSADVLLPLPLNPGTLPRYQIPTMQIRPWIFPQPIEATCPTCVVAAQAGPTLSLVIPALGRSLKDPVLVVRLAATNTNSNPLALALLPSNHPLLSQGNTYVFQLPLPPSLPQGWKIQSAYITGFDPLQPYSVTEQIFVQQ